MKKVLLFLFLCCTFMAVSCSELNNGDGGKTKAELLIGKWQAIKTETYDGKGNLIETYYPDGTAMWMVKKQIPILLMRTING